MCSKEAHTTTYLLNILPTSKNSSKIITEFWNDYKPNLSNISIFGCFAFAHILKQFRSKLDSKSRKSVMVGFAKFGYRLWDPETRKCKIIKISEVNIREDESEKEENDREDEHKEETKDITMKIRRREDNKNVDEVQVLPDKNCWKKVMQEEMDALIENNTWSLVPKPQNKWTFKLKLDEESIKIQS
ncbi:Hypothetical protein CINCED_3A005125 [Cinara cedri]|uniref:Retroviral polymerase SH3-like domain-containing protein n=1 Tax=Cinara cedri TaxID=506608 RepID=A0A5E4NCL2_9HEMI|nr:Hypothetical protein CINCED_3A005125 [Cinara cedri]